MGTIPLQVKVREADEKAEAEAEFCFGDDADTSERHAPCSFVNDKSFNHDCKSNAATELCPTCLHYYCLITPNKTINLWISSREDEMRRRQMEGNGVGLL